MIVEQREATDGNGQAYVRGIVLIVESEAESKMLDSVFGSTVGDDGLIGVRQAECRVSDFVGEHYVYIAAEKK